jgi:hypothetical protein
MTRPIATKSSKDKNVQQAGGRAQEQARRPATSSPQADVLALQRAAGNRAVSQLLQSGTGNLGIIQPKLRVSQAWNQHEQEADRVADRAMSMPEPAVHRYVAPEEAEPILMNSLVRKQQVPEEEDEIQTKADLNTAPIVPSTLENFKGSGKQLSKSERAFFEPRLGHDFSKTRIHSDAESAELSRYFNAKAFTVGNQIFFGRGYYRPEAREGKQLLAHELTHVVQQSILPQIHGNIQKDEMTETKGVNPTVEKPLSKTKEIIDDTVGNLLENLIEEKVPQSKIFIITAKLSMAFGEGLQRGIYQARVRLNYDAMIKELVSKESYDESDIKKFRKISAWQKNAIDEFPTIVKEGLKDALIAAGKEFIEEAVDRLVSPFAERVSDEIGDAIGDFLTGDVIEAIDIIEQPVEDLVQGFIRESGKHLSVAFTQALATNIAETGLTELESKKRLEAETEGEPTEVSLGAEFQRQAVFEAALPFEMVSRNVAEKLDTLKKFLRRKSNRKQVEELKQKVVNQTKAVRDAISEYESRFAGIAAIKRPFTKEDDKLRNQIVNLLREIVRTLHDIDLSWGAKMIIYRIPTVQADINATNRKISEFRD